MWMSVQILRTNYFPSFNVRTGFPWSQKMISRKWVSVCLYPNGSIMTYADSKNEDSRDIKQKKQKKKCSLVFSNYKFYLITTNY